MYTGVVPQFLDVDEVTFGAPVNIGNLVRLRACVLYVENFGGFELPWAGYVRVDWPCGRPCGLVHG